MTGAMFNALCLTGAAVLVTCFFLRRRGLREDAAPQPPGLPQAADTHAFLRTRYAAKTRYRLGVFLFSLAALAAYLSGGGRIVPLVLLVGAALCQWGVFRSKTASHLTQVLQQQFMGAQTPAPQPETGAAGHSTSEIAPATQQPGIEKTDRRVPSVCRSR